MCLELRVKLGKAWKDTIGAASKIVFRTISWRKRRHWSRYADSRNYPPAILPNQNTKLLEGVGWLVLPFASSYSIPLDECFFGEQYTHFQSRFFISIFSSIINIWYLSHNDSYSTRNKLNQRIVAYF